MKNAIDLKSDFKFEFKDTLRIAIFEFFICVVIIFSLFKILPISISRILTLCILMVFFISIKIFDGAFKPIKFSYYLISILPFIYYTEYLFLPNFIDYFFIGTFIVFIFINSKNKNLFKNFSLFIKNNKILFLFLLFLLSIIIWSFISIIWAKSIYRVFVRLQFLFYALLIFLFFSFILFTGNLSSLSLTLFISAILLIVIGLIEVLLDIHFPASAHSRSSVPFVPGGLSSNINNYSTIIFTGLFYILYFISNLKIKFRNILNIIFFFVFSFITFYIVIKANSRANIIAVVLFFSVSIICFYFFEILKVSEKFKKNKKILLIIFSVFIILLLFVIIFYSFKQIILQKINFVKNELRSSKTESQSSDQIRINLIRNGLIMLKNSHFLGVGAGNFIVYAKDYSQNYYNTLGITDSHNLWLEMLVDYGVIIFSFFVFLYIILLVKSLKLFFSSNKNFSQRAKYLYSFSALSGFTISSLSPSNIVASPIMWIFLSFIALVLTKEYGE